MVHLKGLMVILVLHPQGLPISVIAQRTGHDRKTVRKYIQQGLAVPKSKPRAARAGALDDFRGYLQERLRAWPEQDKAISTTPRCWPVVHTMASLRVPASPIGPRPRARSSARFAAFAPISSYPFVRGAAGHEPSAAPLARCRGQHTDVPPETGQF